MFFLQVPEASAQARVKTRTPANVFSNLPQVYITSGNLQEVLNTLTGLIYNFKK